LSDPRADPRVIDLIELAGLWLAADDWPSLARTLRQLIVELEQRFASDIEFRERFQSLVTQVEAGTNRDDVRRAYRRATLG
jgi:hypothetical protein